MEMWNNSLSWLCFAPSHCTRDDLVVLMKSLQTNKVSTLKHPLLSEGWEASISCWSVQQQSCWRVSQFLSCHCCCCCQLRLCLIKKLHSEDPIYTETPSDPVLSDLINQTLLFISADCGMPLQTSRFSSFFFFQSVTSSDSWLHN